MSKLYYDIDIDELEIAASDIAAETDPAQMLVWWEFLASKADEVSSFIEAWSLAEIDDDSWYLRAAGRLGYAQTARRRLERRMAALSVPIPPDPKDGRVREIQRLRLLVDKQKSELARLNAIVAPEPAQVAA